MAENKNIYTKEGYQKLQDELSERRTVIQDQIATKLEEARAQGDLSENSEYEDAKDAESKNLARIAELESMLKNAEVISEDDISKTRLTIGSSFTLRDEQSKEEIDFMLVSANEEDIFTNKISIDSPVGAAVRDKKKNQVVEVTTPAGVFKYKIIKIGK